LYAEQKIKKKFKLDFFQPEKTEPRRGAKRKNHLPAESDVHEYQLTAKTSKVSVAENVSQIQCQKNGFFYY
jgi:hypothetical protein